MPKKLTQNEVKENIKRNFPDYELLSEYNGNLNPITLKHKCGNIYTIKRAKTFLTENGGLCPICNKKEHKSTKKITEEVFLERLRKTYNDEYSYINGFKNMNTKCLIKHNKCGNIWEITPEMLLGTKRRGCPICGNKNRGKYLLKDNYLKNILKESNCENDYIWLEKYKGNNKIKHQIKHLICGNIYEVRPNDFQQGYRCPKCSCLVSKEEKEFKEFIKEFYNGKIIENYRIKNKEIDVFIPDLKIGFEYNGFYWHCDKNKDKNYHLQKLLFFKENGIDLYFIDSIDWMNNIKQEILKSKILHILKSHPKEIKRIYARNCKLIKNIDPKLKSEFLNKNHIQGNCYDNYNFGLFYNDELVAFMSFIEGRININSNNLELLRYATNINYIVVGGFSRLLKNALKLFNHINKDYEYLYSYADRNLSKGNVYLKNGFILDHISKPSYYYVKNNKKINRFSLRKSELKKLYSEYYDDNLTEFEITNRIPNLYRVWNTGNYVFKYNMKGDKK